MNPCSIERASFDALLEGASDRAFLAEITAHLARECPKCLAHLEALDLDEDTLLLYLAAAKVEPPKVESLDRVWRRIVTEERTRGRRRRYRPHFRGRLAYAGVAVASVGAVFAAALAMNVVLAPSSFDSPEAADRSFRFKGEVSESAVHSQAKPSEGGQPSFGLALIPTELSARVVQLAYRSDRASYAAIIHRTRGVSEILFEGRLEQSSGLRPVQIQDGVLGYDARTEPQAHHFFLLLFDQPIVNVLAWFDQTLGSPSESFLEGATMAWASDSHVQVFVANLASVETSDTGRVAKDSP